MKATRIVALSGLVALAGTTSLVSGCKRPAVEVGTTAYIVGPTNDIKPASGNDGSSDPGITPAVMNAAVLVATKLADKRVKFCSGTLVAPEAGQQTLRVLTNHHCFAVPGADGKATKALLVEACSFTTIYFGFLPGQAREAESVGCQAGSLRTNFEGDLAVFTLAHNPPDKYQPLALWSGEDAPVGRAAAIVHYPDVETQAETPPEGGPKLPTAAITVTDCRIQGAFATSEWDLDRTLPYSLRHSCDLIHGSSGSGLIDVLTGTVIGVNWGGIKITYDDGQRVDNVATKASFAQAFLDGREDEVVRQTQAGVGQSGNLGSAGKNSDDGEKKSESFGSSVAKKACGTLSASAAEVGSRLPGYVLLLLPLMVSLLSKRRRCRLEASEN